MAIGIAKPFIGDEEKQAVLEVLDSGQLVQGKWVEQFENAFAELQGTKHAVAVNNGTTALCAALMAHGIGPGDEVIIPSFSFFATASCVLSVGARPVFADIDPDTYCLSVASASEAITPKTRAIMPVHLYGHLADMPAFARLCEERGLILLEDAAQAHLAALADGRKAGAWGTASFSFYPSKNMTTGEGGMIVTNDDHIAAKLRMIRNQGMSTQYLHEVVGYNFRMTNLAAAIGVRQLERLPGWTDQRIANAARLSAGLTRVKPAGCCSECRHAYHQYTVRAPVGQDRDAIVRDLNERGVGARVYYPRGIHNQPIFERVDSGRVGLGQTEQAAREVFSLPVHPLLTEEEIATIIKETNAVC